MIKKLYDNRWALYSLPKSIWFNFKHLPFKQAIKLPILFYNPLFLECKGKVIIDSDDVHFGMIKLGLSLVSFYSKTGITFENHGGVVVFKGKCYVGSGSTISVGEKGRLTIGNESGCTASLKLACYHCIDIEDGVSLGWNCSIVDTDFHRLKSDVDSPFTLQKPYAPIVIGSNSWIAMNCVVMKGTVLPPRCVVSANSLLRKKYDTPEKSLLGGQPAKVLRVGVWRDMNDDDIVYE